METTFYFSFPSYIEKHNLFIVLSYFLDKLYNASSLLLIGVMKHEEKVSNRNVSTIIIMRSNIANGIRFYR